MSDDRLQLTRRKALAGLGTIGAAGAGAGLGTSALFSDEESFEDSSFTAGTLDMTVAAEVVAQNGEYPESEGPPVNQMFSADGSVVADLQFGDVKPGDWWIVCFDVSVGGNPGYVRIAANNFAQYENGRTEPERETDGTGGGSLGTPLDGAGAGELQDAMLAEVYSSYDGSVTSDEPRAALSGADSSLSGTVRETYDRFESGVILGGSANPIELGPANSPGSVYLLLEVPADVGNEIQSDALAFDLVFRTEQVRNNETPFETQRIELGQDAAENTGFQTRSGGGFLGSGYWKDDPTQTNQDGGDYEQLYVTFEQSFGPYYVDSLATFTVGEIESVRYRTQRPPGASQDFFMELFTFPDGSNDDASWYGRQLQALPGDALNKSVSPNTWLTWRTDAGTNQLTFYDFNHDYDTTDSNSPPYLGQDTGVTLADLQSTGSFDWSNYVSNADSTTKNYRDEEVRAFRFATGSAWQDTHEGGLDAIEITLKDGRRAVVDLEG